MYVPAWAAFTKLNLLKLQHPLSLRFPLYLLIFPFSFFLIFSNFWVYHLSFVHGSNFDMVLLAALSYTLTLQFSQFFFIELVNCSIRKELKLIKITIYVRYWQTLLIPECEPAYKRILLTLEAAKKKNQRVIQTVTHRAIIIMHP